MVAAVDNLLGVGLYSVPEAAAYVRAHENVVRSWMYGSGKRLPVLRGQLAEEPDRTVTFRDLVQLLAIRAARKYVSLEKIREGLARARETYGIEHPFATRHKMFVYGKDLMIKAGDEYHQVSGKEKGHHMLVPIVETYMFDLSYDPEGNATRWRPYKWEDVEVVLDPHIAFGSAYLPACGYTAQALYDAVAAEGGVEAASHAYRVEQKVIEAACRFVDSIDLRAAA